MYEDSCRLMIRLKPQAKHESISLGADGTVSLAVTSPPIDNKANEHAIRVLSRALHLPKSACNIIRGHKSKMKLFEISGSDKETVLKTLAEITTR